MTVFETRFFETATKFFIMHSRKREQKVISCPRSAVAEECSKMFKDGWIYKDSVDVDSEWVTLIFEKQ